MSSKAIIAILAVIIIIAAGACVYFFVLNKDNGSDKGSTEEVRDLIIGDTIDLDVSVSLVTDSEDEASTDLISYYLYFEGEGEKIKTETIRYAGANVTCDVYEYDDLEMGDVLVWVDDNRVIYKKSLLNGDVEIDTMTLGETNIDLDKTVDEQVYKKDDFIKYKATTLMPTTIGTVSLEGNAELKILSVDSEEDSVSIKLTVSATGAKTGQLKLTSINEDGYYIFNDNTHNAYPKDYANGLISFKALQDYYADSTPPMAYGEKWTDTIKTSYGDRKVTVQDANIGGTDITSFRFYYNDNNVLYKIETISEMLGITMTTSLVGSSAVKTV